MSEDKNPVCKGSFMLGTACGTCERCLERLNENSIVAQSEMGVPELIKHAAIRAKNGMIILGKCHADCFHTLAHIGVEHSQKADDQGFFTNKGRYVDRQIAGKIAAREKQVEKKTSYLISEDLWSETCGGKFQYDSIKGYFIK